jgi:ABC-type lipoprotein export system ATPase subunit
MSEPDIWCEDLVRIFTTEGVEVQALQGLSLRVEQAGADLLTMSPRERRVYRRDVVGFVWQQTGRNLLPYLTAEENVALPMVVAGRPARAGRSARARELLDVMGVADCADRLPRQMSGGEQQRVAIATAVAGGPRVLLADEPTGELDEATSSDVLEAMRHVNETLGVTTLIVTHDPLVSEHVRRTVQIRDGRTSTETLRRTAVDEHGREHLLAEEFAVIDRVGRLQLPREFVERLDLRDRVRLGLEPDHVSVWPGADRTATPTEEDPA